MTRALSFAFGLVMVAAGALRADQSALVASAAGLLAVILGIGFSAAATVAVAATVVALALSDPSPVLAAVGGLAAVCYLVLRHTRAETISTPTVVGAIGITVVALLGTAVPMIPWVPLVAPLAALAIYVAVVAPLLS